MNFVTCFAYLIVSGLHARIQKKEGNLLVTDLDSTNGTFIDDKRLRPGAVATLSSGSCVTFGKPCYIDQSSFLLGFYRSFPGNVLSFFAALMSFNFCF